VRKIVLKDMDGNTTTAYAPETNEELKKELTEQKKQNLKEHLYMGYLIIGTIAFTLGILISLKRLKANR
jgi:hypothetical protein